MNNISIYIGSGTFTCPTLRIGPIGVFHRQSLGTIKKKKY